MLAACVLVPGEPSPQGAKAAEMPRLVGQAAGTEALGMAM